jgi:branched-chain amino acid transport system permease protein
MLSQLFINGIIAGSIYSLIALGFALIYSTVRFFHFAHGAVYTAGAYSTYAFFILLKLPFLLSAFLGIALAAVLGASMEALIYRPMRKRRASNLIFLIASLGLFIVIQNMISLGFGDNTMSLREGLVREGFNFFGARITSIQLIIIVVSLTFSVLTWIILRFTHVGRLVRAVANDQELSKIVGINSDMVILSSFIIGSALAAGAAILISLDTDMTPTMGFNALLMGVVAVIIGGMGSVPGAVLGGLLVGLAQNLGVWKLPTQWQDAIVFAVLILFLICRPQGFFGKPLRRSKV